MAIIGMDAFFGDCNGLDAFGRAIYEGSQRFTPVPPGRWQGIESQPELLQAYGFDSGEAPHGAFITDFDLDFLHFKIPPNNDQPIPQQLLILEVADRALQDAGLEEGSNVAVIIGTGTELSLHRFRGRVDLSWQIEASLAQSGIRLTPEQLAELEQISKNSIHEPAQVNQYTSFIGNIMASRVSTQWDFSGPAFTLAAEENSTVKALEVAQMLLAANEVEAVVVGAVDLAGGVESVLLRHQLARVNSGRPTLSLDQEANGWLVGEGAGVVVLKRHEDALAASDRIYAVIEAVSLVQGLPPAGDNSVPSPSAEGLAQSCRQALAETGLTPADIGYLELYGSGIPAEDAAETNAVTRVYQTSDSEPTCAIGSVKANIGHTFAASGIASLIKAALCLYERYIPATPNWSGPKQPDAWRNSPFYVAPQSTPWFLPPDANKRVAAINSLGIDGAYGHVILADEPAQPQRSTGYLAQAPYTLFPVAANDPAALRTALGQLEQTLAASPSLADAARQNFEAYQQQSQAAYTVSIVGRSKEEAGREIQLALASIDSTIAGGEPWKTPLGSYFAPTPLGQQGKVTFVYPGAFSSYPGLGRDLFYLFPQLHAEFATQVPNPGELVGERRLYPRSLTALSKEEANRLALDLMADSITMLQSGMTYSTLATKILREQFDIQPQAALGYSLGETTMMYALGLWSVRDNNSAALRTSPLFQERVSGPKNAVREFWGLDELGIANGAVEETNRKSKIENPKSDEIWAIFVLKAPVDDARRVVEATDRVYLTHINTAQEVVISGDPQACRQVIRALDCEHVPVPYSHVIHCEPMASEAGEFQRLNSLPLVAQPTFDLYFAAQPELGPVDSASVGRNIAAAVTQPVDFPALIRRAYNDGSRVFIELGPRSACTWWIDEILAGQPHLAVGIDRRSLDDRTALIRLLAQLASHRVALDLSPLYEALPASQPKQRALVKTVSLLETPIRDVILAEENRQKFSNVAIEREAAPVPVVAQAVGAREPVLSAVTPPVPPSRSVPPPVSHPAPPQPKINGSSTKDTGMKSDTGSTQPPVTLPSTPPAEHLPPERAAQNGHTLTFFDRQLRRLNDNTLRANRGHDTFLRGRTEALRQMRSLIERQIEVSRGLPSPALPPGTDQPTAPANGHGAVDDQQQQPRRRPAVPAPVREDNYSRPEHVIWGEADLLEFAGGKIAPVFGEEYAIIDSYERRVRLPTPPYLLVSRITKLDAERGVFKPSTMTTEYDIPFDAWYATDGQIPWAVSVESGQCDLMLISYLGIDFENKGERVYRLLDCTLTFLEDMPLEGHTLRYDISIDSFARSGDSLLFFFSYNCFVGDTMVLKMRGGCAGFFSDEELAGGKGIITTEKELAEKAAIEKQHFEPLLHCGRSSFDRADILTLSQGDIAAVLGPQYDQQGLNPSLRLPPEGILMLDRIVEVNPHGGAWGLGLIVTEKDLEPEHWYFPCHFSDDQVMAGSLVAEGCSQMLQFYLLYLGFQTTTQDARFQPVPNLPQVVRTRRQIMACSSKLIYRMEITEIGLEPYPYAKANVDIIFEGRVVVDFKNLGLQLVEKSPDDPYYVNDEVRRMNAEVGGKQGVGSRSQVAGNTEQVAGTFEEQVAGSRWQVAGSKSQVAGGERQENIQRSAFSVQPSLNNPPLFDEQHIEEFALGSISACFGPDYEIFEGRRVPRTPNGDLKLISRIVEIEAERLVFSGSPSLVSEYDVPAEPWFCRENSYPVTPYSILMEIGLQPCGFLSAYLGSTLPYPDEDFFFRNLDGDGHLLRDIDLRGKTVRNRVTLLSSTAIQGIIIQKFSYQLACEGEPFFSGTAVFGYFKPQALANQVGLDQGKMVLPWYQQPDAPALPASKINLNAPSAQQLYQAQADKPFYRLAGEQLNFLEETLVIPQGGRHQQGYVYASKRVDPQDWFFTCHFYQDPVMPGSLGVEAIIQALQIYALQQDLGAGLASPYFANLPDHQVVWTYRGQIPPGDHTMQLEVHISGIDISPEQVTIVGDASLWKDTLRIYEVKQIGIRLVESR